MSAIANRTESTPSVGSHSQTFTLLLSGITAEDYLAWVRDPDPPSLGHELQSIDVVAGPGNDRIHVHLTWRGPAPSYKTASASAGLPHVPEVLVLWPGRHGTRRGQPMASHGYAWRTRFPSSHEPSVRRSPT